MTRALAGALALAALLAAGCGRSSAPTAAVPPLVVAITGDVTSWNPYTATDATSLALMNLLYPRLFHEEWTESGPVLRPWLAESFRFDETGTVLSIALRDDARWSDGSPVTCGDVVFTYEAQIDPALAWGGSYLKERIRGVACDEQGGVRVFYSEAYPEALLDLNDDAIVPRAYAAVPLDAWRTTAWETRFIGCGPYAVARVAPGQEAVLARNPLFWADRATTIDGLVLRVFPDRALALGQLLQGGVDVVAGVPPQDAERVAASPRAKLHDVPSFGWTSIVWNALAPGAYGADRERRGCDREGGCPETADDIQRLQREAPHPALTDARVRRALTLATDREDIVRGLWRGYAKVAHGPIVSALAEHDPEAALPHDIDTARALLAEAGYRDADGDGVVERDGRPLVLRVAVNADNVVRKDVLARVSAGVARAGIRLEIDALPRAELARRARARDFDGLMIGWRAGTRVEPQATLHTRAALDEGQNHGTWSTAASDALMDRAARLTDAEERREAWRAWQRLFRDEQPYLPLYEERSLVAVSARVVRATPSPLDPLAGVERWTLAAPEKRP